MIYEMASLGTAPKGFITLEAEPIVTIGAIISNIPMLDKLDKNPIKVIKNGDYLKIDAKNGIVYISQENIACE
jgi:predicted aconitase with swiveling domain